MKPWPSFNKKENQDAYELMVYNIKIYYRNNLTFIKIFEICGLFA